MSDNFELVGNAYERLQRENERLKAERDLAVKVAWEFIDSYDAIVIAFREDDELRGTVTYGDIRKVMDWYTEAHGRRER